MTNTTQNFEEKRTVVLSDLKAFLFLYKYTKGFRSHLFFGFFFLILATVLTLLSAYLLSKVVNEGVLESNYQKGLYYGLILVSFELICIALYYFGRRFLAYVGSMTTFKIRSIMFHHLNRLPMSYFDKTPQGRIATRLTHDVEDLEHFFSSSLGRLGAAVLLAIFSWFAIIFTAPKLGIYISLSTIPIVLITYFSKNKIRSLNWNLSKKNSSINSLLSEYIQGINVIRSFGLEDFSKEKFDSKVKDHLATAKDMNRFFTFIRPMTSFLSQAPLLILITLGGYYVTKDILSIGILITYFRYIEQFTSPIELISREIHVLQTAFTNADRVVQFLSQTEEQDIFFKGKNLRPETKGNIEIKNLSMYYNPGQWILKDITTSIKAATSVGILGQTGSGKTTTISLLARLYPFQKGSIIIDGTAIEDWDRDHLRKQIGFVSQDIFLFKGSVLDNICMGRNYSEAQIQQAVGASGLENILKRKNIDLNFELIEKGENLSAGERQILSICRVLLLNPKILIFDEATANIDPELEKTIQNSLSIISKERTSIIIAHRLHTLQMCDKLIVFKDGKIVADGSHEDLLKSNSYYKELYGFSRTN